MIQQRRNTRAAVWLGLFAMLMIHVGPLISAAQAVSENASVTAVSLTAHTHSSHSMQHIHDAAEHAAHGVDYHTLMGHQSVPDGMPQWLVNLDICGYCDLLTISPPLLLTLSTALAVPSALPWMAVLPAPVQLQSVAHSLSYSRAPPVSCVA